jgi:hypothetical protein
MNTNRRNTQRFNLQIPARFQRLDLLDPAEHTVVSSNISGSGVYFKSEVPLTLGTPMRIFLSMPEQISGEPSGRHCYEGKVVRIDQNSQSGKRRGVAVSFRLHDAADTGRFELIECVPLRAA